MYPSTLMMASYITIHYQNRKLRLVGYYHLNYSYSPLQHENKIPIHYSMCICETSVNIC